MTKMDFDDPTVIKYWRKFEDEWMVDACKVMEFFFLNQQLRLNLKIRPDAIYTEEKVPWLKYKV